MKLSPSVRTSAVSVLTAAAWIASPATLAADSGWYIGANAGQARAKIDDGRIIRGLLANGVATTGFTEDEHEFGFKLLEATNSMNTSPSKAAISTWENSISRPPRYRET